MKKTIFFLILIGDIFGQEKIDYQIKLYSISSQSHHIFRDQYFLPSLKDDFKVIVKNADQICQTAKYMSPGWNDFMIKKVDLIIDAINENWNKVFIYSDVDIQFFRPFKHLIPTLIQNNDIVIQKEKPKLDVCAGFFICRGNKRTLKLWQAIKQKMLSNPKLDDQVPLNQLLLNSNPYKVKYSRLPNEFFLPALSSLKIWIPGNKLIIPKEIILHHANWTIGIENKIAQLNYIKNEVTQHHENKN